MYGSRWPSRLEGVLITYSVYKECPWSDPKGYDIEGKYQGCLYTDRQ